MADPRDSDYHGNVEQPEREASIAASDGSAAVEMLREFERRVDANFLGQENSGTRGWLKIEIHNIIINLGRQPYAIHEQPNSD